MFIPKIKIEEGDRVAIRRDYMTDMGTFTAGHEFNVYNIGAEGGYYDMEDDDQNLLTVYTDYGTSDPMKRLYIYPCLDHKYFGAIIALFEEHRCTFGSFGQYTRQSVVYTTSTVLSIGTILKRVVETLADRTKRFSYSETGLEVSRVTDSEHDLVFKVGVMLYCLDFDEKSKVIIEQRKAKPLYQELIDAHSI